MYSLDKAKFGMMPWGDFFSCRIIYRWKKNKQKRTTQISSSNTAHMTYRSNELLHALQSN